MATSSHADASTPKSVGAQRHAMLPTPWEVT
jgi:hypothetical protein